MRIVYCICFVLVLFSCEKKLAVEEKKYPVHIISEYFKSNRELQKKKDNGDTSIVLPPIMPRDFNGTENFILDDSSNIYYYQLERYFSAAGCGTDMEKDSIPFFLNLKPESLIKLPIESIDEFLRLNFRKGERNAVKIASQKDTLKSKSYFKLMKSLGKYLSYSEDRDFYVIYPTTQEEDTVLYYKKHKKNYNSDSIKWYKKK